MLRLYRLVVLTHGSEGWIWVGGTIALGSVLLVGMATAHLANFPISRWPWRVLAFLAIEVTAEMVVSAVLTAAGKEPIGSVRATFGDMPSLLARTLAVRGALLAVWSLVLAGSVQLVRNRLVREEADEIAPNTRG
jgi:hypothetical protein